MRVPGTTPRVSSGGGRSAGLGLPQLGFNAGVNPGTAMGNPIGAVYVGNAYAGLGRSITQAAHATLI